MSRRSIVVTGVALVCLAGFALAKRELWLPYAPTSVQSSVQAFAERALPAWIPGAPGQNERPRQAEGQRRGPPARVVPVEVARAEKKPVPVTIQALGTVAPIASVAIKSRLETEIVEVHFADGALVNKGDLLFTLDSRALDAQILQAEGVLARDQALLEGAKRDFARYTELLAKNAGTAVNVENAKTQVGQITGTVKADESALKNLRVQQTYTKIYSPITGRISAAAVKAGNFVRPADLAPLATVNQTKPVYVAFGVPQRLLAEVRQAMEGGSARVEASVRGDSRTVAGKLTMVENAVDATTGMILVRATMENAGELLWPGTLVNVVLTLRVEEAVAVPSAAVQTGQSGNFIFVVKDGIAEVRDVKVERISGNETVLSTGLAGGETVVTDGQLLLANGTKVSPRQPKRAEAGS